MLSAVPSRKPSFSRFSAHGRGTSGDTRPHQTRDLTRLPLESDRDHGWPVRWSYMDLPSLSSLPFSTHPEHSIIQGLHPQNLLAWASS